MSEPILCDRCENEVATQGDVCDECWEEYYSENLDDEPAASQPSKGAP